MKQSPEERIITERLAPGVYCRDGFLGTDRRPLSEILDTDSSTVEALGVTHERIAARLADALRTAMRAFGTTVKVGDHLTAVYHEAMGKIPSPFGDGVFAKGEVELADTRTGERIYVTPLSMHLIAAHGFYQGIGSRYRLDPAMLCGMFDLSEESGSS